MKKILISSSCSALGANLIRHILYEKLDYKISAFDYISSEEYLKNVYYNMSCKFNFANINDSHTLNNIIKLDPPDIFVDLTSSQPSVELEKSMKNVGTYLLISNYYDDNKIAKESMDIKNKSILRLPKLYGPRQFLPSPVTSLIAGSLLDQKVTLNVAALQEEYWMHVFDAHKNVRSMIDDPKPILNAYGKQCFSYLEIQNKINSITEKSSEVTYNDSLTLVPRDLKLQSCQQEFSLLDGLDQTIEWCDNNKWVFNKTQ